MYQIKYSKIINNNNINLDSSKIEELRNVYNSKKIKRKNKTNKETINEDDFCFNNYLFNNYIFMYYKYGKLLNLDNANTSNFNNFIRK
jgi:hypothetical protein